MPVWAAPTVIGFCVLLFYWVPLTSAGASIQWDAADMHYPLQKYFADRWLSGLPFWTPYLFAGYPILANPEVGAWYPLHWPLFLAGMTPLSIQIELALGALLACREAIHAFSALGEGRSIVNGRELHQSHLSVGRRGQAKLAAPASRQVSRRIY